jgi:hypothetical protein
VVCFCGLFLVTLLASNLRLRYGTSYVVIYLPEHLLRRYYQAHNLPDGHLKVHLRKLEEALEEAWHFDFIAPRGWGCGSKVRGSACWPW